MLVNKTALLVGSLARLRQNDTAVSHHQLNKNQPTRNLPR